MSHSPIGPSSAKRWINCPGSIGLVALAFKEKNSPSAKEGSEAHKVAENFLKTGLKVLDPDMNDGAEVYAQVILDDFLNCYNPSEIQLEDRVRIPIGENNFGTCDAWFYSGNTLFIYDYKYGQGVKVFAKDNEQMLMYALGILHTRSILFISDIKMVIVQPRLDHIDSWAVTSRELSAFKEKALAALEDNTTLAVGPHCKFCQAKAFCPKTISLIEETYGVRLAMSNALPTPSQLSEEQLLKFLENADLLSDWIRSVKDYAVRFLENGGELSGYGIERSLGNRKWQDVRLVESHYGKHLGAKIYETKLLSPAQLEKVVKKTLGAAAIEEFNTFTIREQSENKLVKTGKAQADLSMFEDFSV